MSGIINQINLRLQEIEAEKQLLLEVQEKISTSKKIELLDEITHQVIIVNLPTDKVAKKK